MDKVMAEAFNQWLQDYTNDPKAFEDINVTAMEFLNERLDGKEPSYGEACVATLKAYMEKISAQQD